MQRYIRISSDLGESFSVEMIGMGADSIKRQFEGILMFSLLKIFLIKAFKVTDNALGLGSVHLLSTT